jgi:hypothetical protein
MPHRLLNSVIRRVFPKFERKLTRTVTMPATTSLVSAHAGQRVPPHAKAVPYISFNAIVGRNSTFHLLTKEQMEELGGVEYRALNALLWLVAGVSPISQSSASPVFDIIFLCSTFSVYNSFHLLLSLPISPRRDGARISILPIWFKQFRRDGMLHYSRILRLHERRSAGLLFSRSFPRLRIRGCPW